MKYRFFKIAVTQNSGIRQNVLQELNMEPLLQSIYKGVGTPRTYTYSLQITAKNLSFLNQMHRGLHGNGTEFFLHQIQQTAYSNQDAHHKVDRIRTYLSKIGLLEDPKEFNEAQAIEMIAVTQTVLMKTVGIKSTVDKLRTIGTAICNTPPFEGDKKRFPIVATLIQSLLTEKLEGYDPSAVYWAQTEQSYRLKRM